MRDSSADLLDANATIKIDGLAISLPSKRVTNIDLENRMLTTADFIEERTGILERRYVSGDESNVSMMCDAIEKACKEAEIDLSEIDFLVVNTLSPDYHDPSQSCLIQSKLPKLSNIPAVDILSLIHI